MFGEPLNCSVLIYSRKNMFTDNSVMRGSDIPLFSFEIASALARPE